MKKRILVIEDEGSIFEMIKEQMDEEQYEFVRARNVSEAEGEYNNSKQEGEEAFICHIVDLQIGSKGLSENEMTEFFYREGYAWIKKVLDGLNSREKRDSFKKRTIICSKYVLNFKEEYSNNDLKGFILVPKKPGFEKEIKKIINKFNL